jgi:hypothetical protein
MSKVYAAKIKEIAPGTDLAANLEKARAAMTSKPQGKTKKK